MDHACPHLRVAGGADEDDEDDEDGADGADGAAEFAMGIDPTQPVYVFELGSGSARLAYNVVTRLAEVTRGHRWLRRLRIVYVMTDFAQKNVDFWMRHAPLQPLFEGLAGGAVRLDCAILDTQRPYEDVALLRSGVRLGAGSIGVKSSRMALRLLRATAAPASTTSLPNIFLGRSWRLGPRQNLGQKTKMLLRDPGGSARGEI